MPLERVAVSGRFHAASECQPPPGMSGITQRRLSKKRPVFAESGSRMMRQSLSSMTDVLRSDL